MLGTDDARDRQRGPTSVHAFRKKAGPHLVSRRLEICGQASIGTRDRFRLPRRPNSADTVHYGNVHFLGNLSNEPNFTGCARCKDSSATKSLDFSALRERLGRKKRSIEQVLFTAPTNEEKWHRWI